MSELAAGELTSQSLGPVTLEDLFRMHYESLVRTLSAAAVGDQEAAADAVQEAFVRAHVHWRRISRYEDPVAWVRRTALNRLRNHLRKRRRGAAALERMATTTDRESPDSSFVADWSEREGLIAAFRGLPLRQRTAAALFYIEDMSVVEVAGSMGVSQGTAKRHLYRARAALRARLEADRDS